MWSIPIYTDQTSALRGLNALTKVFVIEVLIDMQQISPISAKLNFNLLAGAALQVKYSASSQWKSGSQSHRELAW